MIQYTMESAKKTINLGSFILSSDDDEILKLAKKIGVQAPFIRPKSLSLDNSKTEDVVSHALEWYKKTHSVLPKNIVLLQPTSPFRNHKHINKAFDLIKLKKKKALISVIKQNKAIYKSLTIEKGMVKPIFAESFVTNNRQAFETLYIPNGAIYIFNSSIFMKNKKIPIKSSLAYKMSKNSSHDVDTLEDYTLAKKMSNKYLIYK